MKKTAQRLFGQFITFEGPEGSGKSTQIQAAAVYLKKRGIPVLVLREPGGTTVGEACRAIVLEARHSQMSPQAELLLYLAARAQIVHEKILPALQKGTWVLCDRFEDSTRAYQGYGRGLDMKMIDAGSSIARGKLQPDLTILLDIPPRTAFKRIGRRDRMEQAPLAFHERVRRGFLDLARRDARRFKVLDAALSKEAVALRMIHELEKQIAKGKGAHGF